MEKKAKMGLSTLGLLGIVFAILGGVFLILGLCFWLIPEEDEILLLGVIYTLIGALFFVLGVIFLLLELGKRNQANKLIAAGRYIWGEVTDFVPNYNIRINNRHPYIVLVRYADRSGSVHIFRSGNLRSYPDRSIIGKQVKVYVRDDSFKQYYVDLEGVLPKVIEH